MLSRASSDAGTRLRRSKSASTVHSNKAPPIEHLNHEVAHQHALAAATKAFVRAQAVETAAHAQNRSVDLGRSKSAASRKSDSNHVPQREPSLRSTMRPQKTTSVLGVPSKSRASTSGLEKFPAFHITPNTRAGTVKPSVLSNENMRPSSQPKAQRASVSSSMASQQIRKARSMYYASSIQTGSPIPRPPAKYLTTPPPISPLPGESLVTSRSTDVSLLTSRSAEGVFDRPKSTIVSPLPTARPPTTVLPNEAVDKARDKCLQDFQQQRQVKHKPSMFLAPFKKRQEKAKKKSASSSSGQLSVRSHTPGDAVAAPMVDSKPLKEKRSISDSLRSKFKKVFRKGSTKNNTHLPAQQVDATREYYGEQLGDARASDVPTRLDVPSPDELMLQRHKSRSPSFEGGRPALVRASSRGSNRSLHSEASLTNATTSRVTSWSNSSACDTLTQRAIKRLTVIHEAKDSMGSEADHHFGSNSPRRKPLPMSGFAAFRDPMPMDTLMESTGTPVDPKRVFSALMKEIDATKYSHLDHPHKTPGGDSDVFVSRGAREVHSSAGKELGDSDSGDATRPLSSLRPDTAHSNAGSVKSKTFRSFGRALKATIRNVTPSEQPSSSSPVPDRTTSVRGVVRIPRPTSRGSSVSTISEARDIATKDNGLNSVTFKIQPRVCTPVNPQRLTVAATPTRSKALHVPKFHGRSKVTGGPEGVCTPAASEISSSSKEIDSEIMDESLPRNPLRSPKPRQVFSPLSPSIYSRNTDGASILPNDSIMSLDATAARPDRKGSISGSALIITSHSVKSYVIGTPTPQRATESARSSRDWKAWLSHEVSELGNLSTEDISIQYSTPTAHRREFTQISEGSTVLVHELEGSSVPTPAPPPLETPTNQDVYIEPVTALKDSTDAIACGPVSGMDSQEKRTDSPDQSFSMTGDIIQSSTPNPPASFSRPRLEQSASSSSSRMNERFPFIERGRRSASSTNSAKLSRHTPSLAGSQSSSLKATPSPRVYSDFSAPPSIRTKHEANKGPKRSGLSDCDPGNQKENITPANVPKTLELLSDSPSASSLDNPRSLQPLAPSSLNRLSSNLAQYTTSAENLRESGDRKHVPSPRVRLRIRPISPGKLAMRPKSAFDLRNANKTSASNQFEFPGGDSPTKVDQFTYRASVPVKASASQLMDGDALRMMLESPWTVKGQRATPTGTGRRLHLAQSSSTLAFNKEPSPGVESRIIDAVLGDEGEDCFASPRAGNVTPGQRMADRFLRERNAGGGVPAPNFPSNEEHSGPGTPVFL